jgi:hypothetical protein
VFPRAGTSLQVRYGGASGVVRQHVVRSPARLWVPWRGGLLRAQVCARPYHSTACRPQAVAFGGNKSLKATLHHDQEHNPIGAAHAAQESGDIAHRTEKGSG